MAPITTKQVSRGPRRRFSPQTARFAALGSTALLTACAALPKVQHGGRSTTQLGGTTAPTVVTTAAPENPQTPTTTTVEKTITREFQPSNFSQTIAKTTKEEPAGDPSLPSRASVSLPVLRESVHEVATTITGVAQKDTARELGVRLANMRGVLWVGLALLIGGPLVGWRLGWLLNGCIAGAVGLLLVILAQVLPGHEAWFGLGGLLLIPLVAYVWWHGHRHGSAAPAPISAPAANLNSLSPS